MMGRSCFRPQLVAQDGAQGDWQLHIADFKIKNGVPVLSNITTLYQPLGARAFYESHGFTPDGTQVIFTASSETATPTSGNEYLMNQTTNKFVVLTNDNGMPGMAPAAWNEHGQINPNGKSIVWASSRGMTTETTLNLWQMNIDGSNQHEIIDFHNPALPYYSDAAGTS